MRTGLYRGGKLQQPLFGERADGQHVGDRRLAFGQGAGFIEGDGLNLAQLLQRRTAFNQRAAPRRPPAQM